MAQSAHTENRTRVISAVEKMLGHEFTKPELLHEALTHSSYSNERSGDGAVDHSTSDNERLEFLGDAVIGLVIAKILMDLFPVATEGKLSKWRSSLVSRKTLADIAVRLRLGECVFLGRGEKRTGGSEKRSILAATLESVVGAVYLDGGLEPTSRFLMQIFSPFFASLSDGDEQLLKMMDKKTHLQERTQFLYKTTPVYRVVESWGPEHEKYFRVEIVITGKVVASGDGRSKKEAEQAAASTALELLGLW